MSEDPKKRTGKKIAPLASNGKSFVGCIDGLTFGADENGKPFCLSKSSAEDRVMWAEVNARFFDDVADKLRRYAECVKVTIIKESALGTDSLREGGKGGNY